jgi:hypothetical protein
VKQERKWRDNPEQEVCNNDLKGVGKGYKYTTQARSAPKGQRTALYAACEADSEARRRTWEAREGTDWSAGHEHGFEVLYPSRKFRENESLPSATRGSGRAPRPVCDPPWPAWPNALAAGWVIPAIIALEICTNPAQTDMASVGNQRSRSLIRLRGRGLLLPLRLGFELLAVRFPDMTAISWNPVELRVADVAFRICPTVCEGVGLRVCSLRYRAIYLSNLFCWSVPCERPWPRTAFSRTRQFIANL